SRRNRMCRTGFRRGRTKGFRSDGWKCGGCSRPHSSSERRLWPMSAAERGGAGHCYREDMPEDPAVVERGLGPDPATVREVAVLRTGGIRAMVNVVPALRHLRGVYPRARITVAAEHPAAGLLVG